MATSYFFQAIDSKLNRVPEKIKAIKAHSDSYIADNPPQIVMGGDGKNNPGYVRPCSARHLGSRRRNSLSIAVYAGSSHFPSREAESCGATLPVGWEDRCQFPLVLGLKIGETGPLPLGRFENLPGISAKAHAFIESVQPYYGVGKANNCLRFLKELSNRDKHRYLTLTRSRSQVHETRRWLNGIITTGYESRDYGAEIDLFDRSFGGESNVQTSFRLSSFIAFDEPILGDASAVEIGQLLQWLLESVRDVIVPELKTLIENP